ncbi:mechanosensitive ion channel domain-containing protein [Flavobacterium silvaticum]|uniref:mechanosensitive ion channel domain-containing protein n=1 Tax=Flavobacterium silvaticum TaxID=1852020 RepID=UPI001B7D1203|nr:mechanosensitive ion channel domain-containing protein [Flavobacterium silvaticum]
MIAFLNDHRHELISTLVMIVIIITLRMLAKEAIQRFSRDSDVLEHRSNLVLRHVSALLVFICLVALVIIWGVETKSIIGTLSAVITVIGVAFFAQWSILSNITSGVLLLFNFPFRIGDIIRIHDKDFPIEAEIEDIRTFHVLLRTQQGEIITYPNNLLLQKGVTIVKVYSDDTYGE